MRRRYYLTDAVAAARAKGYGGSPPICVEEGVLGINSRNQLAMAEAIFQHRFRERVLAEGATLIARRRLVQHDTVRQGRHGRAEVFFDCGSLSRRGNHSRNCHLTGALIAEVPRSARSPRFSPGGHRAGANRQLRRGQDCDARTPAQRPTTCPIGDGGGRCGRKHRCRTFSQHYEGSQAQDRRRRAPSSARTHRCGTDQSRRGPTSAPERITRTWGRCARPGAQRTYSREGWAAKFRNMMHDGSRQSFLNGFGPSILTVIPAEAESGHVSSNVGLAFAVASLPPHPCYPVTWMPLHGHDEMEDVPARNRGADVAQAQVCPKTFNHEKNK